MDTHEVATVNGKHHAAEQNIENLSDGEIELEDDKLSDIEEVVNKVTDKLGLKINPIVDVDKVILDLTPDEEGALNKSLHYVDFPMKNLVELVQFNQTTYLKDNSTDSFCSSGSYDVVAETPTCTNLETPPATPSPPLHVLKVEHEQEEEEEEERDTQNIIAELKRQSSEALSEKMIETMGTITSLLSGFEAEEGFNMKDDVYLLETTESQGNPLSLQNSLVLESESLSDFSIELDQLSVSSLPAVEQTLIPVVNATIEQEEPVKPVLENQMSLDEDITEETTTTTSHPEGCETCGELSAESLVSDPGPSFEITPQVMVIVHSAPILEEVADTEVTTETDNTAEISDGSSETDKMSAEGPSKDVDVVITDTDSHTEEAQPSQHHKDGENQRHSLVRQTSVEYTNSYIYDPWQVNESTGESPDPLIQSKGPVKVDISSDEEEAVPASITVTLLHRPPQIELTTDATEEVENKLASVASTDSILTPDEIDSSTEYVQSYKRAIEDVDIDCSLAVADEFQVALEVSKDDLREDEDGIPGDLDSNSDVRKKSRSSSSSSFSESDKEHVEVPDVIVSYVDQEPALHIAYPISAIPNVIVTESRTEATAVEQEDNYLVDYEQEASLDVTCSRSRSSSSSSSSSSSLSGDEVDIVQKLESSPNIVLESEDSSIHEFEVASEVTVETAVPELTVTAPKVATSSDLTETSLELELETVTSPELTNNPDFVEAMTESKGTSELEIAQDLTEKTADQTEIVLDLKETSQGEKTEVQTAVELLVAAPVVKIRHETNATLQMDEISVDAKIEPATSSTAVTTSLPISQEGVQDLGDNSLTENSINEKEAKVEEIIPLPRAVLRRDSAISLSSSSTSSSDSEEVESEFFILREHEVIPEEMSDQSSLCSETDIRESMERFKDMNTALNAPAIGVKDEESIEPDLEIVTPDASLSMEPGTVEKEVSIDDLYEEVSLDLHEIHIPLSVILSNNSSRKSSRTSRASSLSSDKSQPSSPREKINEDMLSLPMKASEEPTADLHRADVKEFVDFQIKSAMVKSLAEGQMSVAIGLEAPDSTETLKEETNREETTDQIIIVNSTFSMLSDVPDVKIAPIKIDESKLSNRKSSSSSSDEDCTIPELYITPNEKDSDKVPIGKVLIGSTSVNEERILEQLDLSIMSTCKFSDSSENLKSNSSTSVSSQSSQGLSDIITVQSEPVISSDDESFEAEKETERKSMVSLHSESEHELTADDEKHPYGILAVVAEPETNIQSGNELSQPSSASSSSGKAFGSDGDSKTAATDFTEVTEIVEDDNTEETATDAPQAVTVAEDSPMIDKVLMVNTPDLIEDDSDSSLSEEEGFCESDAMQSILDRMTSSTVSITGEEGVEEFESQSSSSSLSTVARADDDTPEPPTDSRATSAEPTEDMEDEPTPEPPTDTPEPPQIEPSYSEVSEDIDIKEVETKITESKQELLKQQSSVAEALLFLSNDSEDDITEEPLSNTLNDSSLGTLDLSTTINTDPNSTFNSKDKLSLKTKWPKYDPVIGKNFVIACKVRMRGFQLRDKDVKNNTTIKLYRDEELLTIQPKFIKGYFVYKIKYPKLADSGWYSFVVNLLDYEATEGQDINIVLKGVKRTKSMSSIGSLGSLGSLFSVQNQKATKR